jgi:predicted nuclease with TOPRIM domain
LYLSGRNELIEEIINELSQIAVVNQNKDVSKYIKSLKEYIKTDSEWEEFVAHFEKVNPGLLKTLKEKHPELTAKDIRFLCYVYMNLDAKELSIVFNITPDACRRRERRLLQKMNLTTDASLFEYLLEVA